MSTRDVQIEIRELLTKIANDTGYDYSLVKDIYGHQFEFVANQLMKGERDRPDTFENIYLKYFGSFISNEKYINKLKEINEKKREDDKAGI